jgi:glycosyltransferase involved in cell wall biosynthesis
VSTEQEKNGMARVSAIVPAYNAAHYLPTSIKSVMDQTYTDWELVIVDDGSTDGTRELVASYAAQLGDKLRYVHQPNKGLPAARNTGIRNASGELMALLDADDIWLPARLERSVAAMDVDPAIGIVHGRFERVNVEGSPVGQTQPVFPLKYMSGMIADHLYTRRIHLACATVTFRKACIEKAGWFDETMRATEDRDLWFRIARFYKVAFVDEIIARYRVSAGSMSSDTARMLTWQTYFVEKHYKSGACGPLKRMEALSSIYRERGDDLFRKARMDEAISVYSKAALYNPLKIANLYMLTKALAVGFRNRVASGKRSANLP